MANRIKKRRKKTSSANFFEFSLLFIFSEVKLGIKAALNVPSANNLLKVFGSLNATKNASA